MSNHGHGTVLDLSLKDRSQLHILSHNQQPYITMVVGLHYLSCIDVIKVHIGDYNNHRGLTRWADGSVLWQQYKAGKLQPLHLIIASNCSHHIGMQFFQLLGASSSSDLYLENESCWHCYVLRVNMIPCFFVSCWHPQISNCTILVANFN